jgi:ABC-type antimicrobial peptide transport system permease subunit
MLVITVNALSTGLDNAQASVLKPLTGLGTDMTVTRPIRLSTTGGSPFASLSPQERNALRQENSGGRRFDFRSLAKPGTHFSVDRFVATSQLSFPSSEAMTVSKLAGVSAAAGSLTLTDTHISGTVPKTLPQAGTPGGFGGRFGGRFGGGFAGPGAGGFNGPRSINFTTRTVTGIDVTHPNLMPITPAQITRGHDLTPKDGGVAAVLSANYASLNGLSVGSTVSLGGKTFRVVGVASSPLGGTASDVYIPLSTLQSLSGHKGRVNTLQVQAAAGSDVSAVQKEITSSFKGAQVTTAADLAKRIGGSLSDARKIANNLGRALEIVGLIAAVLIAVLLTLSSVAKRTREIGTLRAIGWSRGLVVRQVSLEVLAQGVLGGMVGAILGLVGIAVINGMGLTLQATIPSAAPTSPFGFGRFFSSPSVTSGSTNVHVSAPADLSLLALAVALAVLCGLIAGAVGGLRAAQLRPASALRSVE